MARIAASQREALSQNRRNQILEAALRVWARHGFDASPVEAIAREAGLAKGTLYLYFATKESILEAIIARYSLLPDMTELAATLRETPPEQAIPLIARRFYERLRERAPLLGLVVREFPLRRDEARVFVERIVLPVNRLLASYLDRFVAEGVLRPLDTFVAARALVGMLMIFVLTQYVFGGDSIEPISDDAVIETAQEIFLRGALAPRPGG
ncbi:Fatty acid metabolism regulator protein [Myxococcaceae bacterium]|jgi:AcrR family transcriptional regulator|nr:Fatty acid metabolism regulator protein [Myxococcaceae bacterium]